MNRMWIVAKNEFLKRVKTRAFILTTLLGPLAFVAFVAIVGFISVMTVTGGGERTIAVVDQTGVLFDRLAADAGDQYRLVPSSAPIDTVRARVLDDTYNGYLVIPEDALSGSSEVMYHTTDGGLSSTFQRVLERSVESVVEDVRLEAANVTPEVQSILSDRIRVRTIVLTPEGETAGNAGAYAVVGFIMGFLIYISMLVYGSIVMRGVIAEKTSRVVEILVSSVRPYQLLLGKVLGIGAMGLVQMVIWAILIMAGTVGSGFIIALFADPASLNLPESASQQELLAAIDFQPPQLGAEVFIWFVLFFLVGYLLYASIFAAIGSAVEQEADAQGFMLPVMIPIILSMVFVQAIIEEPNSTLAVVLSMLPLFSPVPMVVRIAVTDVPFWQVGGSFLLSMLAFFGAVWVSSRIYRVGILMYGKKPTLKDLIKWARYA
ncbi:MAG: ABC-2 type transport system permease protein [Rhodothermales bacterium]|jgi:ABC-2 type transport system permease protein